MKIFNVILLCSLTLFSFAQTTISANGRSFTFNKEPDQRSGDWSRSITTYQDVSNDTIYIGSIDNDDTYGISYSLQAYYLYDFQPSSMKKPSSRHNFILKEKRLDNYGSFPIVSFTFENEEKFDVFYAKLISSLNSDYKQKVADAENVIVSADEQALLDKSNKINNEVVENYNAEKNEYAANFYSFDSNIHSSDVQIVTVYSLKNEEVLKYDRGSKDVFQKINGEWKKIGVFYNNFDNYLDFANKVIEIESGIFGTDKTLLSYEFSVGNVYDFRLIPDDATEIPPAEMQITANNNTVEQTLTDLNKSGVTQETFTFNGKTGELTSLDRKEKVMYTSGGKLTVAEMAILFQLFRTVKQ